MIKKTLLILTGIGIAVWAGIYLHHSLQIRSVKPEIEKGFYAVNISGSASGDNAFPDIPLGDLLDGKTIIGFGEATHGTDQFREGFKEFAKIVVQQGRTNIIIFSERDFADSWKVNEFITTDSDSSSIGSVFPYSSAHDRELILWLKEFNAGKAEEEKVLVFGADCYTPRTAAMNAIHYSRENRIELPDSTRMVLNDLAFTPAHFPFFLSKYQIDEMVRHLEPMNKVMQFSANKRLTTKESLILEGIRSLQDLVVNSGLKGQDKLSSGLRDSLMFRNVEWAAAQKKEAKVLIFSHNSHLEKVKSNVMTGNNGRLGWLLNQKYGDKFYMIATDVEKGTYRAKNDIIYSIPQSMYKIGSIISESVSAPAGFLDLHASPKLEQFFNKRRYITFGNVDAGAPTYPAVENFASAHDAVFWIKESSPMVVSNANGYSFLKSFSSKADPDLFNADELTITVNMSFDRESSERYYYDSPAVGVIYFSNSKIVDYQINEFPNDNDILTASRNLKPHVDSLVLFIAGDNTKRFTLRDIRLNSSHHLKPGNLSFTALNYELDRKEGMLFTLRETVN